MPSIPAHIYTFLYISLGPFWPHTVLLGHITLKQLNQKQAHQTSMKNSQEKCRHKEASITKMILKLQKNHWHNVFYLFQQWLCEKYAVHGLLQAEKGRTAKIMTCISISQQAQHIAIEAFSTISSIYSYKQHIFPTLTQSFSWSPRSTP
jgi:hypothetical protein